METMNNMSQPEPEVLVIDGLNVEITPKEDGIPAVKLPNEFDAMTDEQKNAFKEKVSEGSKTIGTYYRKLKETNEKQKSLSEWEEDLKKREERLKSGGKLESETRESKTDEIDPLWKRLGLKSEAEEEDYMIDHPVEYQKALRNYLSDQAKVEVQRSLQDFEQRTRLQAQETILTSQIKAAGVDPAEVMAFAKEFNMPYSAKTFDVYTRYHSIKTDPLADATIKSQQKQIHYIEPSGSRNVESLIHKLKTDPDSLKPDEIKILKDIARPK